MKQLRMILLIVLLSVCLFATSVMASGFGVFTQGASAMGQANAVVAHSAGTSSVYFNPALLTDGKEGRTIELGLTAIYADRSINLDSGGTEENRDNWNFPFNVYYSCKINDRWSVGFGLYTPFGLSTKYDDAYAGRYIAYAGEIKTLNINPVLAYRVNEKLSIAVGLDIMYLDATLKNKINQNAVVTMLTATPTNGFDDIDQKFSGEGWGHGANLGLVYKITDNLSFGATYRTPVDIAIDGRATFNNVDPSIAPFFSSAAGGADLRMPAQSSAGLAYKISPDFIIEAGVRWEDWESTNELKIEFDTPILGQNSSVLPRDWTATWAYNLGGHYQLNESFALNAGYFFGENAIPSSSFEPMIPDADAHLFTLGCEWLLRNWQIAVAFGYEMHKERDKNNDLGDSIGTLVMGAPVSTAQGQYNSDLYLLGLSLGYKF